MNPLHRWLILIPASLLCFSLSPLPTLRSLPANAQTRSAPSAKADRFVREALKQFDAKQYAAALKLWEQALSVYRSQQNRRLEAKTLNQIGNTYLNLQQYPIAIARYQEALPLVRAVGDRDMESSVLRNIGYTYGYLQEYQKTIEFYQQALPILKEVGNRNREAQGWDEMGQAHELLSQYPETIAAFQQSLRLLEGLGDSQSDRFTNRGKQLDLLRQISSIYQKANLPDKAAEFDQRARRLQQTNRVRGM